MQSEVTHTIMIGGDGSAASLIAQLEGPVGIDVQESVQRVIDAESALSGLLTQQHHRETFERTAVAVAAARESRDEHRAGTRKLENEQAAAARGSWARAGLSLAGFAACFASEFAISLKTLPFLLNVDPASVTGTLLAAAPPSALAVLDLLAARLLEEPWHRVKDAARTWRRSVLWAVRIAALAAVFAGNVHMVFVVADAREEAMRLSHALDLAQSDSGGDAADADPAGAAITLNDAVVNRAVLAFSVWVAIDGALFLLWGLDDARAEARRASLLWQLARRRSVQARLDAHVQARNQELAAGRIKADAADVLGQHAQELTRRKHEVQLKLALRKEGARMGSVDHVTRVISGEYRARDAARQAAQRGHSRQTDAVM